MAAATLEKKYDAKESKIFRRTCIALHAFIELIAGLKIV